MKRSYERPDVEWIKLVSSCAITESKPELEEDETSVILFGES